MHGGLEAEQLCGQAGERPLGVWGNMKREGQGEELDPRELRCGSERAQGLGRHRGGADLSTPDNCWSVRAWMKGQRLGFQWTTVPSLGQEPRRKGRWGPGLLAAGVGGA